MQEITISLSENILKLSTVENGEFKGVSAELTKDVVQGHEITDLQAFTQAIQDLAPQLTSKSLHNLALNIVVDPQEVIFKFVTISKAEGEMEDQLLGAIEKKIEDTSLDETYFSYLKLAPFVYQFIGIEKGKLEKYLELSNHLGTTLKSVVPWVSLLPKFVDINEPAIFISKIAEKQYVALSEFNGIFFSDAFEKDKSTDELKKIVEDLAVYKRKEPINRIYIYNYDSFSLDPDYEVLELEIPNTQMDEAKGYEIHLLVDYMTKKDPTILASQLNLLNLLPVPAVTETKNKALVPVVALTLVLLVAVIYGGSRLLGDNQMPEVLQNRANNDVLSEANGTPESTPTEQEQEEQEEEQVLERADLSVRIENGAGIPGVAGRTEQFMEDLGYEVESIGNADTVGRGTTLIRINPELSNYLDLLQEDMDESFDLEVQEDLEDDLPYGALIILGTDVQI